jgi:hypothetical protein
MSFVHGTQSISTLKKSIFVLYLNHRLKILKSLKNNNEPRTSLEKVGEGFA